MSTVNSKVMEFAKNVIPSKIGEFIVDARAMANELEVLQSTTPLKDQALGVAKIFHKYGCL